MFRATMCPSSGDNCVYATLGTCYSVWLTVWYAGACASAYQTVFHTEYHQEKLLYVCDTWYLLFCMDDFLVCRSMCSCIPDSHPHRITSGEKATGFMRLLVLVILCGWLSGMQGAPCIPDSHPYRRTSNMYRINTVVSPDDGHIVARNMWKLLNMQRINCAPSWLYLQDYTEIQANKTWNCRRFWVKNSWWWTEELSETCTVLFQK